ncbi:MAG: hypothetical protein MZV70_75640 [Desulfobacterales bacterium]|nr:hypothetical protein [Desulfobacterales bacterium]
MNRSNGSIHPVFIFVLSIVALAASLALYIYWYIEVSAGLKAVIATLQARPESVSRGPDLGRDPGALHPGRRSSWRGSSSSSSTTRRPGSSTGCSAPSSTASPMSSRRP